MKSLIGVKLAGSGRVAVGRLLNLSAAKADRLLNQGFSAPTRKIGQALAYDPAAIITSPAAHHFASCSYRDYDVSMPRRMTIAGQIEQLIGNLCGSPICDDCITDRLNLSVRSQACAGASRASDALYDDSQTMLDLLISTNQVELSV